jgi:hypothetical protein
MIYLLLDETEQQLLGVVSQDVPWGPFPPLSEIAFPEGYGIRHQGMSWEIWSDHPTPPPLSARARQIMAAHAILLRVAGVPVPETSTPESPPPALIASPQQTTPDPRL